MTNLSDTPGRTALDGYVIIKHSVSDYNNIHYSYY